MNPGHKHSSQWGFGEVVYHKSTGDKGMITGIMLRPHSAPCYRVVFSQDVSEKECFEMELTEEQPTAVEAK